MKHNSDKQNDKVAADRNRQRHANEDAVEQNTHLEKDTLHNRTLMLLLCGVRVFVNVLSGAVVLGLLEYLFALRLLALVLATQMLELHLVELAALLANTRERAAEA